ncbi:cytochrome P450 [Lentzea atacamensis]|uniref:Cytochrome P450 n=1 Tax=Lentzea atacamensis TaxID=531938 RepID=A0ABX9E0D1_9PSEU|nr:cytochrome P450 [Lentzea atacamensis]
MPLVDLFTFTRAELTSPVQFCDGRWVVSDYDDVRAVLADPVTFLPDNALTAVTPVAPAALRALVRARFSLPPTLANNGSASHAGLRRLVASFFTPARVAAAEPRIRALVLERLGGSDLSRNDLVGDLAWDLPAIVLMELLGLENVDIPTLKRWSSGSLEFFWGNISRERQLELVDDVGDFHQWLIKRYHARDGELFCALADAGVSAEDSAGLCYFLLIAGQETTTQLLSTALRRALQDRSLWARLPEPGVAESFVEDVLRTDTPVVTWRRLTAREVVLSGVRVPAGAELVLLLSGKESDPRHLAFGYGRHFCLGAGLARLEAAVVLRTVAAHEPSLRLTGEDPEWLNLLSFRAPKSVTVAR